MLFSKMKNISHNHFFMYIILALPLLFFVWPKQKPKYFAYPRISWKTFLLNILFWPVYTLRIGIFKKLSIKSLKEEVVRREKKLVTGGKADFGDDWYEEAWNFVFDEVNSSPSSFSPVGFLLLRELFIRRLRVKLRIQHEIMDTRVKEYLHAHPIRQPIVIVGLLSNYLLFST